LPEKNIIKVIDLNFSYDNHEVFHNANIDIIKDKITAIYGDSGSGKSTLLNILSLLFREYDNYSIAGEVRYNGINILSLKKDLWKIRRKIIYISQVPNPLNTTIYENIVFPLKIHGIKDKRIIEDKVKRALISVNLFEEVKDRLNESANDLSGGQKQKLCFARALVLEPDILLLDEPTSSLDTKSKSIIEDLILRLGKSYTIVFVSHDLDQIEKIADDVYVCENRCFIKK